MSDKTAALDCNVDVQSDRIVVFDQNLKTVSSSYGLRKLFKKVYQNENILHAKPIEFYAPDLDDLGIMHSFQQIAQTGGQFIVDRYYTIANCIQHPFWDRICTFGYQSRVYTIHYNSTEQTNEEAQNKVLNRFVQDAESTISDQTQLLDCLYQLSNSGLEQSQQKLVDTIINSLCAPTLHAVELLGQENGLSARELQVANLVAEGKTTAEIASILYVTPKTVDFHRSNIRKKLHLDNRTSLSDFLMSL